MDGLRSREKDRFLRQNRESVLNPSMGDHPEDEQANEPDQVHQHDQTTIATKENEVELEFVLTCRVCGAVLCRASELLKDDVNQDPSCGSYFLEAPLDWMDEAASSVSTMNMLSSIGLGHGSVRLSCIAFPLRFPLILVVIPIPNLHKC